MRYKLRLNEPTVGHMELPRNTEEADLVSVAKIIRVAYRGRFRGAWFVENLSDPEVQENEVDEWLTVRGRGGLAVLDEAVVWYENQGETKRVFSSQPACAMLGTMIDEAKARGCFANLDYSFTATEDSEGNTWNDSRTLEWRVGTSLLDIVRKIAGLGIDFEVDYEWEIGTYTLHAYQNGMGSDKSSEVIFIPGKNCLEVTQEEAGEEIRNVYLLEYGQGQFSSVEDSASISAYRRRERGFNVGQAGSSTEADEYGQEELSETKDPKKNIRIEVDDHVEPMVFVDYGLGDWVGYYDRSGEFNKYRVRGIDLDWGEDRRFAKVRLELSSIRQELEIRNAKSISKLGAGLSSDRSQPDDVVSSINTHNNDPNAHPNRDEFVELNDTPGAYTGEAGNIVGVKTAEDGLEFVVFPKNNYAGNGAPTAGDDSDDGYSVGSHWHDITNDKFYVCLDASVGAAVWVEGSSQGTTTLTGLNDTPSAYTDQGGKLLRVNSGGTGIEFSMKHNLSAGVDPAATDDDSAGYEVGSRWANTNTDKEFVCLDATTGAAVWVETTQSGSSGTDADAIHDNVADEIHLVTEKASPVAADVILGEDSEDSWNKKRFPLTGLLGGGGASASSYARVYNSGNISVPDSSVTTLTFDSERWDTDNFHDLTTNPERLTIPEAGFYTVSANVWWSANTSDRRHLHLYLNGTTQIGSDTRTTGAGSNFYQHITTQYYFEAGDYIEVKVYQKSGSTLTINNNGNVSPEFMISKS